MATRDDERAGAARQLTVLRRERRTARGRDEREVEILVPASLEYFRGHFEGDPLLPGVAQLTMAVLTHVEEAWPDLAGKLRHVSKLKFARPIRPDDIVLVHMERQRGGGQVVFHIDRGDERCTKGVLGFSTAADP
jgi:3-hydroxymyristoyl/3-hydroxydecanoyl-(acyl carrier protein) dehydratase